MGKEKELIKLSASSIKTYGQCPRKYYYTYINKPDIEKVKRPHLELGLFVHDVLEDFHKTLMQDPTAEWKPLMSNICKVKVGQFELDADLKKSAKEQLADYLEDIAKNGLPPVYSCEEGFNIKISEDVLIRGYIDRIDLEKRKSGDLFKLVDYKTGRSRYLDEFQLLLYGLYLLHKDPTVERFNGEYIALAEGCKKITYKFTLTDVERVRKKILQVADEIRADQTWETRPQFLCNYCDFNEICPDSPCRKPGHGRRDW